MTDTGQAEATVRKLLESDEEQLYEELGIRSQAIGQDPSLAGSFDPPVVYDGIQMGALDDVKELGRRLFRRWNREAHGLLCGGGSESREQRSALADAFRLDQAKVGALIATLCVTQLGLSPAIAAVLAAIAVKRFLRPSYEEFCAFWGEALEPDPSQSPGV
jgi:hypothetical protein